MAVFIVPGRTFMGDEALRESGETLKGFGKKALIVTGKHVGKSPMMGRLTTFLADLGLSYSVYDDITGEPTVSMVDGGVARYRAEQCDFLIGLGGSPLDAAKAISAMSVLPGSISAWSGKMIEGAFPPVAAIPTTAGTGSEATKFTIITDAQTDTKLLLKGNSLLPSLAIVDYTFSADAPSSITAATGIDALTHAIEAYTSRLAMPMTDVLAVSAVKRIMKYLPLAYQDGHHPLARKEMAIAAYEAGICINNSSVTIVHGMSRPIGALFHVPHGLSNGMLLPTCLGFALSGAYERFGALGRAIGVVGEQARDEEAALAFLDAVSRICIAVEIPTPAQYGIQKETFLKVAEKMAQDAIASGSPGNTRREVKKEDCIQLYKQLY